MKTSLSRNEAGNGNHEQSSELALRLFLLALVLFLTFAAPVLAHGKKNKKPVITFAVVNKAKTAIDINGENLHIDKNTTVILGRNGANKTPIDLILSVDGLDTDGKQVIAIIPEDPYNPGNPLKDGTYLLTVKTKKGKAEFHATLGAGISGYQRVIGSNAIANGNGGTAISNAVCPAGKVVISGGFFSGTNTFNVRKNYPLSDNTWQVMLYNTHSNPRNFQAYAICADL